MIFVNKNNPGMFLEIIYHEETLFQVICWTMTANQVQQRNFVTFPGRYEQNGGTQ